MLEIIAVPEATRQNTKSWKTLCLLARRFVRPIVYCFGKLAAATGPSALIAVTMTALAAQSEAFLPSQSLLPPKV